MSNEETGYGWMLNQMRKHGATYSVNEMFIAWYRAFCQTTNITRLRTLEGQRALMDAYNAGVTFGVYSRD